MSAKATQKQLAFSDVFTVDFWRYLIRACSLFLPGIIFLVLGYFAFWKITQGKDLMVITLEHRDTFAYFILAIVYWAYVTWYSSRIVGKARYFHNEDNNPIWTTFRVLGPRLMSFTCFTIILLAFLQLPAPYLPRISETVCFILLLLSFPFFFVLHWFWNKFVERLILKSGSYTKVLQWVRTRIAIFLLAVAILVIIFKNAWMLLALLLILQLVMVLLFIIRRHAIEDKNESFFQQEERSFTTRSPLFAQLKGLVLDKEDRAYFRGFNIISTFAAFVYLLTVFSVTFAVGIGTFPFVLIAFSVLLGLGNFVSTISILGRFNFHLLFIALALLIGWLVEPHYTSLPEKQDTSAVFTNRQQLKEYFTNWVNQRKQVLDSSDSYPVYFVLADGGASRSGYWAASVLSLLEDTTKGKFSQHLFCLSGASGGSVGNAAFFRLLYSKNTLPPSDSAYLTASTKYLASDFLTYTLARMLGPDIFRYMFPLKRAYDRAAALSHALEHAPGDEQFMYDSLGIGFTRIVTQKQKPYNLPILCINTTRMQDGSPAIISNINIADSYFNKRLDVLNLIDSDKDIRLSSAVVLGASFPYVSPAGRIDFTYQKDSSIQPQYFVDGGYFDNSGAGVVNEMINGLWKMMFDSADTALYSYRNKLKFYILHITNEPYGVPVMEKVHPLVNDLAAPLKTLAGSFGTQTSVNDLRLKGYITEFYRDASHYIDLNLYREKEPIRYSMNWVISDHLLRAMRNRLRTHEKLNPLITRMKAELK
jgi:hypothetical protein